MTTNLTPKSDVLFTESPVSWNTRYITPEGFECQFTLRRESGQEVLEKANAAIAYLLSNGCSPVANRYSNNGSHQSRAGAPRFLRRVHPWRSQVPCNLGWAAFDISILAPFYLSQKSELRIGVDTFTPKSKAIYLLLECTILHVTTLLLNQDNSPEKMVLWILCDLMILYV